MIILGTMIDDIRDNDGSPKFVFKGGSALELRFADEARTSRDVDLAYRGAIEDALSELRTAGAIERQNFTARFSDPETLAIPWSSTTGQRIDAKMQYLGRPFATLPLEIVATTGGIPIDLVPTLSLAQVGLDANPECLPCLGIAVQIAEKVHACTDPLDGDTVNRRVHDVMDLIIIHDLVGDNFDRKKVRGSCIDTFTERDTHTWPPVVSEQPGWKEEWARLVDDNTFYVSELKAALLQVNTLIRAIEAAA